MAWCSQFFCKEPDSIFGFIGHQVSAITTQWCRCSAKAAIANIWISEHGNVPIKLYLQKTGERERWIWLTEHSLQTPKVNQHLTLVPALSLPTWVQNSLSFNFFTYQRDIQRRDLLIVFLEMGRRCRLVWLHEYKKLDPAPSWTLGSLAGSERRMSAEYLGNVVIVQGATSFAKTPKLDTEASA